MSRSVPEGTSLRAAGYDVRLDTRAPDPPLASIIVVSFNQARYVQETLESIGAQDSTDFEVIFIDDASPDNSAEVALAWFERNAVPVVVLQNVKNQGVVATLATAAELIRTPLVSLLAADDLLEPSKLRVQTSILVEAPASIGFVYSDAHMIADDGTSLDDTWLQHFVPDATPKDGDLFVDFLCGGFHVPVMSMLIRTEVLRRSGAFGPGLAYEDTDLNLRLAHQAHARFSDYPSVRYRVRDDGLRATVPTEETHRTLFSLMRPWMRDPRATKEVKRRYMLEAYWLYEHHKIGWPHLVRAAWDARTIEALVLVPLALFRAPLARAVDGYAFLQRVAGRSKYNPDRPATSGDGNG